MTEGFIPPHGGYQKAQIVYDATVYFCDRFIGRRCRTHDQMVQAARSGKQNIIEGDCLVSGADPFTAHLGTNTVRILQKMAGRKCCNALEGNTLTEIETKVGLEDGITIGGKPLRDHSCMLFESQEEYLRLVKDLGASAR